MFASLLTATPEADTAYGARHGGNRRAALQLLPISSEHVTVPKVGNAHYGSSHETWNRLVLDAINRH